MKPTSCIHFNGIMNECCKIGINYDELTGGRKMKLPCLVLNTDNPKVERALCDKFLAPTKEQMEADEAEFKKRFEDTNKARKAIVAHIGAAKGSACGTIACPVCGVAQNLHYTRSGYNGHIHALCMTKGCVSWME